MSIHRVTIQKETVTQGAGMGQIRAWADVKTNYPCRVNPLDSHKAAEHMKDGLHVSHDVYFYLNPEVDEQHRLVWVDPNGVTRYLYVQKIRNPHGMNRYWLANSLERRDVDNAAP